MKGKIFLVLLFTIIIGIQPALAQSKNDVPAKPAAQEKPVKEAETIININLASDKEFTQALEAASDIELVNEEAAKTAQNDKGTNQGKSNDKK